MNAPRVVPVVRARRFGRTLRACLAGLALCGAGSAEITTFAKLDDLEGESEAAGHEGWMEVAALGAKVWRSPEARSRRTEPRSSASAGPFFFRKEIDKASPYLTEALLRGTEFDELLIEQLSAGRLVGCYRMRGVRLVQSELGSGPADDEALEELGFSYKQVEWHYFRGTGGDASVHVGSTWDFGTQEGGVLDVHDPLAPTIDPIAPLEVQPGARLEVEVRLRAPGGDRSQLVLSSQPSEKGLVEVVGITGKGGIRMLDLQVGSLFTGSDRLTLTVSDGERSSTRVLAFLIAGDRTPYEIYMSGFFGERMVIDPSVADPLRDPDGDRLTNLLEFFLGTNPAAFTRRDEALTFEREKTGAGTILRMRYHRRMDSPGLSERFEGSRDLNEWRALGPATRPRLETEALDTGDGAYLPMEARILLEDSDDERYFMRFAVEGVL